VVHIQPEKYRVIQSVRHPACFGGFVLAGLLRWIWCGGFGAAGLLWRIYYGGLKSAAVRQNLLKQVSGTNHTPNRL